jgi:uncharacterized protein (DUF2235 family)
MPVQRRLIVCLDGTWNQQDSSTNVLHHFNLVCEGVDPETGLIQKKYYHPGVGTSPLDSVSGGAFGFGLEKNVRDAYNWLVQNYSDLGPAKPDEVYIFGFSRGAYTARSLVGFIGECGLLRRGAPLTVRELWTSYCILGRDREKITSAWDDLFKQPKAPIRPIAQLATDPWLEEKYGPSPWIARDPNPTEKLLIHWSRRIQITYLGVYDTVGAIGWDAFAIPGLTSRIAAHNNMRPTTIIQHCRHALAIDENRSSFNHTPFVSYIGLGGPDPEIERNTDASPALAAQTPDPNEVRIKWERTRAAWRRKIEQRWFVGAHSNIGGGYDDNRLGELPMQWLLQGANLSLSEQPAWDPPPSSRDQQPCDSFAEFAQPLWTQILRAKRNYRVIDPDPLLNASPNAAKTRSDPPAGFALESINERVSDTVFNYWEQSALPLPPNLYEYSKRRLVATTAQPSKHSWPGDRLTDFVALIVWATLAAAGLASLCQLIGLQVLSGWHRWAAYAAAFAFPFVDLSESFINFKQACGFNPPSFRAFLDSVYWVRALGVALFACGLVNSIRYFGLFGWQWNNTALGQLVGFYWPLPLLAAAAVILATKGSWRAWLSLLLGPAAIWIGAAIVFALFRLAGALFQARTGNAPLPLPQGLSRAGLLLVLQFAFVYFWRAFLWTADPMAKANLGSIVRLQLCATPRQVRNCLDRWHRMLVCRWRPEDPVAGPAAARMRDVVSVALWRDIVGFIPVYTCFLMFGLWFGAYYSDSNLLELLQGPRNGLAWWWLIPVIAAAANYLEDVCHLAYVRLHARGAQPSLVLTIFSSLLFAIKAASVTIALVGALGALVAGTLRVSSDLADWRAKCAILVSSAFLLAIALLVVGRVVNFFDKLRPEAADSSSSLPDLL